MKVSYPDKKGNDLRFANEYGKYLISNNNTWHGGVHLEGANVPIRAIADGRIIAYRLEEDYKEIQRAYNINFDSSQKDKKQKKLLYSNSFVLVQHDLVLEKEEIKNKGTEEESTEIKKKTVVFYSLYNHLMCLNGLVDKDLPNFLSSKSFSVKPSVKNIMRGIEVYPLLKKEETAVYLRDKENKVFLPLGTPFSFAEDVDENHPNELQVEKPKKGGGVTQVIYKRIIITDDTIEKDSNKAYYIIGKSSGIYKKEETTHKAKIIGVYDKLDREIKGGSVFELPDTGSKLLKIIVKGEKLITVSEEGLSKKWYKLSEGGYIQKTQVLDRNTLDDSKFKRGEIEACDIPIKSDNIIGYTGAMNSEEAPDYYACQLDVFMTEDVNSFLENEFEAGKASDNKYTILPKDTELKQWISLDGITLKRGLEVKVLALKGGYAKVKIPKIITRTLTDKEINLSKNKRTYRKYSEVKDEEIIDFNSINRKFGGVLTKEKDLLFYGKKRTANNISVYCTPEHGGKELWIPYSSLDETAEFEIVKERRTHYKSIFNASKTKDYLSRVLLQKEEKSGSKKVLVHKNSTDKKKEKDNLKKIERVVPRYLLGTYSKEKAQTFSCREKNFDRLNKLFDNQLLNSQARLTWMYACDKGGNKIEKDSDNKYPTPYRKVSYNLEAHQLQQLQEQAFIREGEWSEPSSVTDYISRPEEQQDPSIFKDILSAKEEPISSEEKLVNVPEKKGEVSKLNDYVSRPNLGSSEQSFFDTLTLEEEPILHPIENEIVCVVPRRLLGDYKKGYYTCKKSTYEELNKLFDYQLLGDTAKLYLIKVYGKKSKEVKKVGNTYSKAYRKVKYKIREHDEELNYIETKKHIGCHQAKIGESVSLLKDESDVFLVVGTNEEKEGYCTEKAVVIDTSYGEEIQIEDKSLTYKEVQIDYTMGNKSVIKKGWIERKILKEKNYFSAYDWYKFGFTSIKNGGKEFMFKIKGLRDEKQTDSEFVDGVWGVLDIDKNNTIDLTDVKGIYSTKETQEVLSKLVWKHKTEWSYSYEDIEGDVRNYYESKIDFLRKNQAPENVINLVEKAKDIKLEELKKQVGNLMFWKEASGLTYSDGSAKEKSSLPKKSKSGLSVIEDIDPSTGACTTYYESPTDPEDYPVRDENNLVDLLAPPKKEVVARAEERKKIENAKLKRIFPNTDMVYHFHPIAFVNHMKKIFGGGSEDCPELVWGNKVSCEFRKRVVQISKRLKCDPNHLMTIMALETHEPKEKRRFRPSVDNGLAKDADGIGYVGLIQFGNDAVTDLNTNYFIHKAKIKKSDLKVMTAEEQLCYVEYYLARHKGKLNTLTDFYLAILWPDAVGQGGNDNFIVFDDDASGDKKKSYWSNGTFHSEEGEYKANRKGTVYEQKGKAGGKTYVWEIRNKIEEVYKKGEVFKNTSSDCTCNSNCSCDKKCVDLTDKVTWVTQFNKSEIKDGKMQTDGCWRTSEKLLLGAGLKKGSGWKEGMIITALEDENHSKLTLTSKAKDGVYYIDNQLEKGNPVLVGLNHTINYRHSGKIINADVDLGDPGTTDHYVVIVGRGCEDNKVFYRFYEVGTSWAHKGQHSTNKLFLDKNDHSLKGIPVHNKEKKYTVTQVRKNK